MKNKSIFTVGEAIGHVLGRKPEPVTILDNPTNMMVIGAGLDRTATSSLREALHRLGLKSYTMKLAVFMDTDLWHQHALQRLNGEAGIFDEIADAMARQGYNATVDIPNCFYYKELMNRYPKAKVILTLRPSGEGDSYATSILNSVARVLPLVERVPLKWLSLKPRIIMDWVKAEQGCPHQPVTRLPTHQCLADSYDSWVQQVQQTVPSEQLLVFRAPEGWEPLCEFLGPLDPIIKANCQQVLDSKESFPFANDTAAVQRVLRVFHGVVLIFENLPTFFICGCLVWWMAAKRKKDLAPRKKSPSKYKAEKRKAN